MAAVFVILIGGIIGTTWDLVQAEQVADAERRGGDGGGGAAARRLSRHFFVDKMTLRGDYLGLSSRSCLTLSRVQLEG